MKNLLLLTVVSVLLSGCSILKKKNKFQEKTESHTTITEKIDTVVIVPETSVELHIPQVKVEKEYTKSGNGIDIYFRLDSSGSADIKAVKSIQTIPVQLERITEAITKSDVKVSEKDKSSGKNNILHWIIPIFIMAFFLSLFIWINKRF